MHVGVGRKNILLESAFGYILATIFMNMIIRSFPIDYYAVLWIEALSFPLSEA